MSRFIIWIRKTVNRLFRASKKDEAKYFNDCFIAESFENIETSLIEGNDSLQQEYLTYTEVDDSSSTQASTKSTPVKRNERKLGSTSEKTSDSPETLVPDCNEKELTECCGESNPSTHTPAKDNFIKDNASRLSSSNKTTADSPEQLFSDSIVKELLGSCKDDNPSKHSSRKSNPVKHIDGLDSTSNTEISDSSDFFFFDCIAKALLDDISKQEFLSILSEWFILNQPDPHDSFVTAIQSSSDTQTSKRLASQDSVSNPHTQIDLQSPSSTDWIKEAFRPLEDVYQLDKCFDSGTYGSICKIIKRDTSEEFAAKFVKTHAVGEREIEIWSLLKHPNILPLLESVPSEDAHIFVSPLLKANLWDLVAGSHCKFRKVIKYMKDALIGLEYLHSIGLCHLDVKEDNVLVDEKSATLCDFGFSTYSNIKIKNGDMGMPDIYRPPEASEVLGNDVIIPDGQSCDMWGVGVMLVELMAKFPLVQEVEGRGDWHKQVHPVLNKVLQKDEFRKRAKGFYPDIDDRTVLSALDLIHRLLRKTPEKRLKAKDALRHPFFSGGTLNTLRKYPRDFMWKEKESRFDKMAGFLPRKLAKMRARI